MIRKRNLIIKITLYLCVVSTAYIVIYSNKSVLLYKRERHIDFQTRGYSPLLLVNDVAKEHVASKTTSSSTKNTELQSGKAKTFTSEEMFEKLSFNGTRDLKISKCDKKQWSAEKKLNVIIVPHSHNDPGWLLTFEQYFKNATKHILDNIVQALDEKPTRTFIWAEMSYLSLWWVQANETMRSRMRNLIVNTKQLEIVTGGWVMTDEANSFYYAMIEQMIEGHEWLRANVDASVRPRYGWSIDPFGYTPTMAYLLKRMGFDGMLIQRVNFHIKSYMAQNQRLEFNWRQSWSRDETSDIFCHVMPFKSYSISASCGPDQSVCLDFDFKNSSRREIITKDNVEKKSLMLLNQYRKKSQFYGGEKNHNVVLIPHGQDFRYDTLQEAHDQFENLERLIEYMNSNEDLNVNVRFGTLKDYFELEKENLGDNVDVFSGDFFNYIEDWKNYWTGYYTSRPFYKRLDRLALTYLRSAEILFSYSSILSSLGANKSGEKGHLSPLNKLFEELVEARRNIAIFQHHDAITGTAKAAVVLDYQDKLMQSLKNCKNVIEQSATRLLGKEAKQSIVFSIDDVQLNSSVLIDLSSSGQEQTVVIFNPSSNERNEIVSLKVNSPYLEIYDSDGTKITDYQLSLVWENSDIDEINQNLDENKTSDPIDFDQSTYELLFQIAISPLSTKTLRLKAVSRDESFREKVSQVKFIRQKSDCVDSLQVIMKSYFLALFSSHGPDVFGSLIQQKINKLNLEESVIESDVLGDRDEEVVDLNTNSKAHFSLKTGLLQKIVYHNQTLQTKIEFVQYKSTGGAYIFRPDGPAQNISYSKLLKWVRIEHSGSIRKRVCSHLTVLIHCVDFFPSLDRANQLELPSVRIWNLVDLRRGANDELAMRVTSDIRNERIFYTDLNGFQYIKRKTYLDKLPIQGNVYPMPSGAFIQDDKMRMSLLTGQPLGVASLNESTLEVFLDRHLDWDDSRGLGEGVEDNRITPSRFLLHFERVPGHLEKAEIESQPSLFTQMQSFDLLNPLIKLVAFNPQTSAQPNISNQSHPISLIDFSPFLSKISPLCDIRILNIRSMQSPGKEPYQSEVGLILHRLANGNCADSNFTLGDFFGYLKTRLPNEFRLDAKRVQLNMREMSEWSIEVLSADSLVRLDPMTIESFRINFS